MDNVREELIKILRTPIFPHELADPAEAVADYLRNNGVTIQRWIPVTERLPDAELAAERKKRNDTYSVAVLATVPYIDRAFEVLYRRSIDGRPLFYTYDSEEDCSFLRPVTHWMPLPKPPKTVASSCRPVITNGDWIRSMTNKDLAEFLGHVNICSRIQWSGPFCDKRAVCEGCVEAWLDQSVELEDGA